MKISLKKKAELTDTEWWAVDYFQDSSGNRLFPYNTIMKFFESKNFVLYVDYVVYEAKFFLNRKSLRYIEMVSSKIPGNDSGSYFFSISMGSKVSDDKQRKMDNDIVEVRAKMGQTPNKTQTSKSPSSVSILEKNSPPPMFSLGKEWQELPLIPIVGMTIDIRSLIQALSDSSYKVFEDFCTASNKFYTRLGSGVIPLIQEIAEKKMFGIESVGRPVNTDQADYVNRLVDIMFTPLLFKNSNDNTTVNIRDLSEVLTKKYPNGFRVRNGILYICLTFSLVEDAINELNAYAAMGVYGIFGIKIACSNPKLKMKLLAFPVFGVASGVTITDSAAVTMQSGYYIPVMKIDVSENAESSVNEDDASKVVIQIYPVYSPNKKVDKSFISKKMNWVKTVLKKNKLAFFLDNPEASIAVARIVPTENEYRKLIVILDFFVGKYYDDYYLKVIPRFESASDLEDIVNFFSKLTPQVSFKPLDTPRGLTQREEAPTIAPPIDKSSPLWMDVSYMTVGSTKVNVFSLGDSLKNAGFEIGKDYNVINGVLSVNRNSPKFKEITRRFDEWVRNSMWGLTKIRTDEADEDEYQRNPAQQLFKIIPKSQLKPGEQDIRDAFANKCIEDLEAANLDVFYLSGQIYYKLEDAEKVEKIVQKYDTGLGNYLSAWKSNPNSPSLPPLFNKVINQDVTEKIELLNAQTQVNTAKEFVRSPDSPYNGIPLTDKDISEIGVGIKQFEDSFKASTRVKFVELSLLTKTEIVNGIIQEKQMIPGYFASIFGGDEGYSGIIAEISRNVASYDKFLDISVEYGLDIEEYSSYRDALNRDDAELSYVYQRLLKQNSMNTYAVNKFLSQAYFEIVRPIVAKRNADRAYEIVGSFITYIIFEYIDRLSKAPTFSGTEEANNKMKKVLKATNRLLYQTFMNENYATRLAKNLVKDPIVFLSKYPTIENAKKSPNYQDILKVVANDIITFAEANRYKVTSGNTSKEYYLYEEPDTAIPILKNTYEKEFSDTVQFIQIAEYNKNEELIGWKTVFTE